MSADSTKGKTKFGKNGAGEETVMSRNAAASQMRAGFQRGQQNERLLNLRKFRGRREALKRGGEDGVRFRGAARRLIELRE